jgi:enamine deaminase RidA (YjgF/YER057c/UK114 family)
MSDQSPMKKTFYSTPNHPYERRYGYYRAVRKGPYIAVSGTTPFDPATQKLLHPGEAGKQAAAIFTEIIKALEAVGAKGVADVIRVRIFLAVSSASRALLFPLTHSCRRPRILRLLEKFSQRCLLKMKRSWAWP